jgi:hypothetical protein
MAEPTTASAAVGEQTRAGEVELLGPPVMRLSAFKWGTDLHASELRIHP